MKIIIKILLLSVILMSCNSSGSSSSNAKAQKPQSSSTVTKSKPAKANKNKAKTKERVDKYSSMLGLTSSDAQKLVDVEDKFKKQRKKLLKNKEFSGKKLTAWKKKKKKAITAIIGKGKYKSYTGLNKKK